MKYDTLIRNAPLIAGTDTAGYLADVAILEYYGMDETEMWHILSKQSYHTRE